MGRLSCFGSWRSAVVHDGGDIEHVCVNIATRLDYPWALLSCAVFAIGCAPTAQQSYSTSAAEVPIVDTRQAPTAPSVPEVDGPRIRVTRTEIEINDRMLEWNSGLVDRVQQIEPLFEALNALRVANPKALQSGECAVDIAPDVPFMAAASVLQTSTFAGCPIAWVSTGSSWIKLRMPFPKPPDASSKPEDKPSGRRQIALHFGTNEVNLGIFAAVRVPGEDNREELQQVLNRSIARDVKAPVEMASTMMEGCKGAPRPCPGGSWLTADAGARWSDARNALSAIVAAQQKAANGDIGVVELRTSFRPRSNVPLDQQPPTARLGVTQVSGRLPPAEIQRIIRANFGHFRTCYEEGLKKNPKLTGRVALRFVIGRDGRVTYASEDLAHVPADSRLPDEQVKSCILDAFGKLEFPQPEGGIVTVVYPIMFSPGE
jgi:hypothetical protein